MTIYLSGPMTGLPEFNIPAFNYAASALRSFGYQVVVPHEVCPYDPAKSWADYVREDLRWLLKCEAVATLPGYTNSRGANMEVHVATQLDMPVKPVAEWLQDAEKERSRRAATPAGVGGRSPQVTGVRDAT